MFHMLTYYLNMLFRNYIFQSLIYILATLVITLTIYENVNIGHFYWTRISIFIAISINAICDIVYYLKLFFKKKERPAILMTIDFIIKVIYIFSFSIFCFI